MKSGTKFGLLAFVVAIGCTIAWFSAAREVDLPSTRAGFVAVWLSAVAFGVTAFVKGPGWIGVLPALAGIVIGGFLTFTVYISPQEVASDAIQVGDTIPPFTSVDDRGQAFDSASLDGKPVLMKFFRAHW
jgi:CHASE2 domain-containing sensor protein